MRHFSPLRKRNCINAKKCIYFIAEKKDKKEISQGKKMEERLPTKSAPSKLSDIETDETEKTVLIDVFMPAVRMAQSTKAVNRTVTFPAWLNAEAQKNGINFSQLLQEAIKTELHLSR